MPSLFTAAAVAACVSLCLAAPPNVAARSAFEVKQVEHGKLRKNGPLQMMRVYEKYAAAGAVAPSEVVEAAAKQTGEVSANPIPQQFDKAYISPVTLGNSQVMLDFDTGSSDLWAFSSQTPGAAGHSTYDTSSGRRLRGQTWSIVYGDNSAASGIVFADTVVIGGVTATSQAVEAATSVSASFKQEKDIDGLLGLAFSSINNVRPNKQTTFFDTVKPTLQKGLFTADLKAGEPGSYTFGYIDSSKYTGAIKYVPVNSGQGFWQFNTNSLGSAIADTGTSLVFLPTSAANAYYSQVAGARFDSFQGGYVFPCSSNLPDYDIVIGGRAFTIPGDYINYAPINANTCFGGLQRNTGIPFSILGDVFLKAVYAIFDDSRASPRIGFATQS